MYIIREIFHLQFGKYKEAKALMDEAAASGLVTMPKEGRLRLLILPGPVTV